MPLHLLCAYKFVAEFADDAELSLEYITLNYASGYFQGSCRFWRLVIPLFADFWYVAVRQHRSLDEHHR
jgi:hypothetical protein